MMQGTANLQSLFPTISFNAPQRAPVEWKNNQTQLNAANLNTLTTNIIYNRTTLSSVVNNMNNAFSTISTRNAGWKTLDSSGNYNLGEVFNDYDNNKATAPFSHAEGEGTFAYDNAQHVQGKWNENPVYDEDDTLLNPYAHIVGGGTDDSHRLNIHTVDWDGNAWYKGDVTATIVREEKDYSASFTDIYSLLDTEKKSREEQDVAINARCNEMVVQYQGYYNTLDGKIATTKQDILGNSTDTGTTTIYGVKNYCDAQCGIIKDTYLLANDDDAINKLEEIVSWINNNGDAAGAAQTLNNLVSDVSNLTKTIASLTEEINELKGKSHEIYSGTGMPNNATGDNGDIYIQLVEEDEE